MPLIFLISIGNVQTRKLNSNSEYIIYYYAISSKQPPMYVKKINDKVSFEIKLIMVINKINISNFLQKHREKKQFIFSNYCDNDVSRFCFLNRQKICTS